MASSLPFSACRMIEDAVDTIVPSITMHVHYRSKHVTNACTIKPPIANGPPRITITGYPHDLYTLVMTDPDAPSPSEPSVRELVHWIITDIPGGANSSRGNEILCYFPPCPYAGIHRCIFIFYKQKGPLGLVEPPPTRANFHPRAFARQMDLVAPVASVYFNAQREPMKRKLSQWIFIIFYSVYLYTLYFQQCAFYENLQEAVLESK